MKTPVYSTKFNRDYKLAGKRGENIAELKRIMLELLKGNALPPKNKDHALSGDYTGCRECHVEPDWLLVYQANEAEVTFVRVGTHSDLF